jgi:hypothetical protein
MDELELAIYKLIDQQKEVMSSLSDMNAEEFKKSMLSKMDEIISVLSIDDKGTSLAIYKKAYNNIGVSEDELKDSAPSANLKLELSLLEEILYEIKNIKNNNLALASEFFGFAKKQEASKAPLSSVSGRPQETIDTSIKRPKQESKNGPAEDTKEQDKESAGISKTYIEKIIDVNDEIKTLVQLLPTSISSAIKEMNSSSEIREYINSNRELSATNTETLKSVQKEVFNTEKNTTETTTYNNTDSSRTPERGQTISAYDSNNTTNNYIDTSRHTGAITENKDTFNNITGDVIRTTHLEAASNVSNAGDTHRNDIHTAHNMNTSLYEYNSDQDRNDLYNIHNNENISNRESSANNMYSNVNQGGDGQMPVITLPRDSKDIQRSEVASSTSSNTMSSTSDRYSELRTKDAIPSEVKLALKSEKAIEDLVSVMKGIPDQMASAVSSSLSNTLKSFMQGVQPDPTPTTSYPSLDGSYKS